MATGPFVGQRLTSLPCDVEVGPSPTQKVSFSTVCPLAQFGVTAPERILRCKTRRPVPGQSAVTLEFVRASSRSSRARGRGARRLTQVSFYPSIHTLSCTCTYPLIVRAQPHPLEYLSKKGDDARGEASADRGVRAPPAVCRTAGAQPPATCTCRPGGPAAQPPGRHRDGRGAPGRSAGRAGTRGSGTKTR